MSTPSNEELAQIQQRVASQPTNLQYRFELGVALSNRHDYATAITKLQRAISSPPVRLRAMGLIAEAFDAKSMNEMAARMREWISRESGDEGDSGSAPVPAPTRPVAPLDSSGAKKTSKDDPAA